MKTITRHWNDRDLHETVKYNNNLFRFVTGLRNGGGEDCVYMWTQQSGWKFVIGKYDTGIPEPYKDVSYVSNVSDRLEYASALNILLKDNIKKLF